jgi:hypothetical protein
VCGIGGGGSWLADSGFDDGGLGLYYEVTGGAVNLFSAVGTITLNRMHGVVCVSDNKLPYADVRQRAARPVEQQHRLPHAGSTTLAANIGSSPLVGSGHDYTLHACAYWPRALSALEASALSADPFALVRTSDRMYAPYPAAGGGGGGGSAGLRSFTAVIG